MIPEPDPPLGSEETALGSLLWEAVERYRAATTRVKRGETSSEAWDELVDARRMLNQALSAYANGA